MTTAAMSSDISRVVKEKNLREILDGLLVSQRQDILSFSKGHLNEANLPKHVEKGTFKSWKSAKKPGIKLVQKSSLPASKRSKDWQEDTMKQTILNFSVGTTGTILPPQNKAKKTPTSLKQSSEEVTKSYSASHPKKRDIKKSDGILIEELHLPTARLKRAEYYEPQSTSRSHLTDDKASNVTRETGPKQTWSPSPPPVPSPRHLPPLTQHQFVPSHLDAVTKRDQFHVMKKFETDILRKQDTTEQNVMSGVKAVEHLERKLRQGLDNLRYDGYGPNFHRLQIYSTVLDDLIQESSIFGPILENIKCEYDDYIASLLDGQTAKHRILHQQVDQLRGATNSEILQDHTENVRFLEDEALRLLEDNERLREELLAEEKLLETPKEAAEKPTADIFRPSVVPDDGPVELADKVEQLKGAILEKLDTINELKTKLRTECVPSTVCSHLEQCIKETEVEIQKLTTQVQFFDRSIADMEEELQNAIETADTTEKDARRVWKRITAVKNIDSTHGAPGAGVTTMGPGGPPTGPRLDSDEEQDEELKWGWYIS